MAKFLNLRSLPLYGILAAILFVLLAYPPQARAKDIECNNTNLLPGIFPDDDLQVTGPCYIREKGVYAFGNVNIFSTNPKVDPNFDSKCEGPALIFEEPTASGSKIDFWAQGILVENNGCLKAGSREAPFGEKGAVLTIHLYGADQGAHPFGSGMPGGVGILCQTQVGGDVDVCGIPHDYWDKDINGNGQKPVELPGHVTDYFYQYSPLAYDDGTDMESGRQGYFGYKAVAVSYGGTLELFGKKGSTYLSECENDPECKKHILDGEIAPSYSGASWARLNQTIHSTDNEMQRRTLVLDRKVDWGIGDQIVVTTTDYVPGHSEQREIQSVAKVGDHSVITLTEGVEHSHNGERYKLRGEGGKDVPADVGPNDDAVETRAAVALLTRSIRIVSEGEAFDDPLPSPEQCKATENLSENKHPCYFGGHMIFRQGVLRLQIQGVEFYQMGQGGRIGHYPVHFHVARKTPKDTLVKDSSVHDSMTRWIVLHGAQDVTLARNVGYKSIGHGFYLEDATEIDNKLYSNIGILARAAVQNAQNPRHVPGILAWKGQASTSVPTWNNGFPYASDYVNPTVFWFTNSWNEFVGNMAVGATGCGAAYWPVVAAISGPSASQNWEGYANIRVAEVGVGATGLTAPLKKFQGNYAATAYWSFNSTGATAACHGIGRNGDQQATLEPVENPLVPTPKIIVNVNPPNIDPILVNDEDYYPRSLGNAPNATQCDATSPQWPNCSMVPPCAGGSPNNCVMTVLDGYTSSFHWTEGNFAAIWLRPAFFLLLNSAVTDVQGGGVSFVTGGSYTESDVKPGIIMLAARSVFVGHTQQGDAFASDAGPFNPATKALGFECATNDGMPVNPQASNVTKNFCLNKDEGLSMPTGTDYMNFQRFLNIYDGPFDQDSNAFLDIERTPITDCHHPNGMVNSSDCLKSDFMWGRTNGIRYDATKEPEEQCYLPNAAIAWKQQNGFFYPPAFRSENLYFDNVDIRHYVVEPLFLKTGKNPFTTDIPKTRDNYCTFADTAWKNFTDIDRQTILVDNDGTLTGLCVRDDPASKCESNDPNTWPTFSINDDSFFNAPVETFECRSDELFGQRMDKPIGEEGVAGTAKTNPYEHVTTVVYPGCASTDPPPGLGFPCGQGMTNKARQESQNETWSQDCSAGAGPTACFGVPLYRQYQTGPERDKPDPDARRILMMGPSVFGRINLTTNNGLYYIDTLRGNEQADLKFPQRSVFGKYPGGERFPYYVFLIYAKPEIEQTYLMYVGEGKFNPATDVKAVAVNVANQKLAFDDLEWDTTGWTREYPYKQTENVNCTDVEKIYKGVLAVTMKLKTFTKDFEKAREKQCSPSSFCEKGQKEGEFACVCSERLSKDDPVLYEQCVNNELCRWSGADVDCPLVNLGSETQPNLQPRCLGFAVTLAEEFPDPDADIEPDKWPNPDTNRPKPLCFDFNEANRQKWDVTFARNENSGACSMTDVGMTQFCNGGTFPNGLLSVGGGGSAPQQTISALMSDVQMLVQEGKIAARHARGPSKKLSKALKKIEKGKSACRQLTGFVKRINKRVRKGKLAEEDAAPLIDEASQLLQGLGCSA